MPLADLERLVGTKEEEVSDHPTDLFARSEKKERGVGPRRLTLLPISPAAFADLAGDDKKWWDEQESKFAGYVEGKGLHNWETARNALFVFAQLMFRDTK